MVITISCPITWHSRVTWIEKNCYGAVDRTCWAAWQIGYDDIYYEVNDCDAMFYYLIW